MAQIQRERGYAFTAHDGHNELAYYHRQSRHCMLSQCAWNVSTDLSVWEMLVHSRRHDTWSV